MRRPRNVVVPVGMAGAALLALAGCGRSDAPAANEAAPQPANAAAAPAMPADGIPAYPGATAEGGDIRVSGGGGETRGRMFTFHTPDPPARVIEYYAGAAGRAGYGIDERSGTGRSATLLASRGGDLVLRVTATPTGDSTMVDVVIGEPSLSPPSGRAPAR
ncbi:MAG: hypothetical protein QOD42_2060 [Sphingomonadales bacterium]|jgi:hypothetical protein|nr:hypothetical protein [Sphingomonadales bacterium]